jgi:DNA-binding transcriptional MerR regulator
VKDHWDPVNRIFRIVNMKLKTAERRLHVPEKRYRIGELVRYSPFSRQTIHNYTIMGLIREVEWTEGGHRLYDESVFERLSRIMELRKTRSLAETRRILREEETVGRSGMHDRDRPFSNQEAAGDPHDMDVDAGDSAKGEN